MILLGFTSDSPSIRLTTVNSGTVMPQMSSIEDCYIGGNIKEPRVKVNILSE